MKRILFILASALLAFFVTSTTAQAAVVVTVDLDNAPSGAHFANRSAQPACTVTGTTVSCNSYTIGGVGNTNAELLLTADYSAIVDCFNAGVNRNNPIESHETSFSESQAATLTPNRNGQLSVGARSVSPGGAELDDATTCPNANWDARIRGGSLTLDSFTYSLTFAGFTAPAVLITGP
jgi:hypothetical protein